MNQFLCGAAKEKLTPPAEMLPVEALGGRKLTLVLDDLYVRVLALKAGRRRFC